MNKETVAFVRDYSRAVLDGHAAVFAGAGLSKPAGYVDWKELLRAVAEDLGLDIDKESDMVAVAQFHVNEQGGNRAKLNEILIEEFTRSAQVSENHHILARLPIRTYWTTNYDQLIEKTLTDHNKRVDVKISQPNMAYTRPHSDAVVYKMHGDVSAPHEAVLTKDDYDQYNVNRQVFTTALQGDLVSKTFLFIGFSFNDPNLDYILSRVKVLLGNNQRQHFCFMRKIKPEASMTEDDLQYATIRQELRINDLKRYGIRVILLDDYAEIPSILTAVARIVASQNVFISGSAHDYGGWTEERALTFVTQVSSTLISKRFNVISGFGLGIGSSVITAALEEIFRQGEAISERLHLRPFPQGIADTERRKAIWRHYREDIMKMAGIAIFVFGNKLQADGSVVTANGMIEEFDLAIQNGVTPVPVGVTGYAARDIWTRVMDDFEKHVPHPKLRDLYVTLNDDTLTNDQLIDTIVRIVSVLAKP